MSDQNSSGNLSIGDVISFVALLMMGVIVFFGMNFMTLGDRIPSIIVAILTVVLMTVFVFLAAYAKAQDRYQSTWKKVQVAMVVLYILALIPCYVFSSAFFEVQFDKERIMKQVNKDTEDLNKLFAEYNRLCEQRASAYHTALTGKLTTPEGRADIARLIDSKDPASINQTNVNQIVTAFTKQLKGEEYQTLEKKKKDLVEKCKTNFKNWNILLLPKYVQDLDEAKGIYAEELAEIYAKTKSFIEEDAPEFDINPYITEGALADTFKEPFRFSFVGLVVVLFLGFLGLLKYLLGKKSAVVAMKEGDTSVITNNGGYTL